jgi:hypothetical protein
LAAFQVTAAARVRIAPVFPDGYDRGRHLAPLFHSAIWHPNPKVGADIRRQIVQDDPLLFALLYLDPVPAGPDHGDDLVLGDAHGGVPRMRRWMGPGRTGQGGRRTAMPGSRSPGSSLPRCGRWPAGTAATSWRCPTPGQANEKLADLKDAIEGNDLLLHDFPHLRPARPWTVSNAVTQGRAADDGGGDGEVAARHPSPRAATRLPRP